MKKIFILFFLIISFSFYFFIPVKAQTINSNQCWEKEKCIQYRETNFALPYEKAKDGFIVNPTSANTCNTDEDGYNEFFAKSYGFCVASSEAKTNISIAGRNSFTGIQDFISYIYTYSFAAASIVAIIIIIISGIGWIASGGNTSTISSAKKRIGGAIIGLVLLALSYTILYTINPYLVNFKPLNIYMINEESLATFCSQIKDSTTQLEGKTGKLVSSTTEADCGETYFIQGNKANTCLGDSCDKPEQMCGLANINTSTYSCIDANITGKVVRNSSLYLLADILGKLTFAEGWEWEWVNSPKIFYVCNDGFAKYISSSGNTEEDDLNKTQLYRVKLNTKISNNLCQNNGGLKGFVLRLNFNENVDPTDEEHYIGIANCKTNECIGIDLGDEEKEILKKANKKYFITEEQLKKGLIININAANVFDIDEDKEREKYKYLYN